MIKAKLKLAQLAYFLSLSLFCSSLFAECSLDSIANQLSSKSINANFSQTKHIAALVNPLTSSGIIWMSDQSQLVWQVTKPIKSTLLINQNQVIQFNRKDERLDANNSYAPAGIAKLFHGIASGNLSQLSEQFETKLSCKLETWQIMLTPKHQQLQSLIAELTIQGSDRINGFSYTEARGDHTQVAFNHLPDTLQDKLIRYLD